MKANQPQYTAIQLADRILRKINRPAGETINLMKLQALLYYCEAWSLAAHDSELFSEGIQAWDHGAAIPSLWEKLSIKGWNDLAADDLGSPVDLDAQTEDLLNDVLQAYGEFPAAELEKMIRSDAPWKEARRGLPAWDLTKRPIDKSSMARYYKSAYETEQSPAQPQEPRQPVQSAHC